MTIRRFVKNKVIRWINGNVVVLNVDLGFNAWSEQTFRLDRITTPEQGQPGYVELENMVNTLVPVGAEISIDCTGFDNHGCWLAEVYIPGVSSPASINQMLLNQGLAVPRRRK